jgi:CarD family transcriptional regulator
MATKHKAKAGKSKGAKGKAVRSAPKAKPKAKAAARRSPVVRKPAPAKRAAPRKPTKTVSKRPPAKAAAKVVKQVVKKSVAQSTVQTAAKAVAAPKAVAKSVKAEVSAAAAAKKPVVAVAKPVAAAKPAPTLVSVSPQVKPGQRPAGKPHLQLVASRPAGKPHAPTELLFKPEDFVVYPTHGVGRVTGIETQEISGMKLTLFVVHFEKDKMTLRVPVAKASTVGMRRLSSPDKMRNALKTLKGRARVKRTMWSRRAQEYEAKINSGDPISIAEVVRDLHRNAGQPEQSYSERQIYEAALDRLARELAAVERIDEVSAAQRLEKVLRAA